MPSSENGKFALASIAGAIDAADLDAQQQNFKPVPDSRDRPDLAGIAAIPNIADAIAKAWAASGPDGPGEKMENGFWIAKDSSTDNYYVIPFSTDGAMKDRMVPGPVPVIDGTTTVVFFHTHPNTTAEGYFSGPSPADINFAQNRKLSGILMSHEGLYYFGPPLPLPH